jgi:hypothetical protein
VIYASERRAHVEINGHPPNTKLSQNDDIIVEKEALDLD